MAFRITWFCVGEGVCRPVVREAGADLLSLSLKCCTRTSLRHCKEQHLVDFYLQRENLRNAIFWHLQGAGDAATQSYCLFSPSLQHRDQELLHCGYQEYKHKSPEGITGQVSSSFMYSRLLDQGILSASNARVACSRASMLLC